MKPNNSGKAKQGAGSRKKRITPKTGRRIPETPEFSSRARSGAAPKAAPGAPKPKKKAKSRAAATRILRGFKAGKKPGPKKPKSAIPPEVKAKRTRPDGLIDLYAVPLPDPIKLSRKLHRLFGTDPPEPDDSIMRAMVNWVRSGLHAETAARICGIDVRKFRIMLDRGFLDPDSEAAVLMRALDIADAQDEGADIRHITMGVKHAKDLEWKRERKTPQRWGPKVQAAVGGFLQSVTPPPKPGELSPEDAGIFLALSEHLGLLPDGNGNGEPDNVIDISAAPEQTPEEETAPPSGAD